MERFRSFIKSAFSYPRLLRTTHPVTAVSIIVTTIMFSVYTFIEISRDYSSRNTWKDPLDIFLHISLAVLFFSVFALCLESIRPGWSKPVRYAVYGFFALLSLLMSFITSDYIEDMEKGHVKGKNLLLTLRDSLGMATIGLYIAGLIALALLLAIYFSYSHDIHQRFNDHVMNAHAKIFFTSIIYGVIQLGVIFLTVIVMLLLYDDAFKYLPPVLILINGLFFVPAVVCALTRQNENANMFMQVLVRYVMLTIVLLAFGIIYIYILKLVITRSVPSNSVYAILTALFIVSMFICYMCTVFEESGFLQKFAVNAPLIFAPFVLMQCYTVFVRINQYGLTPKRYFGIAFILFEIVYIIYYTFIHKHERMIAGRNLLLIICAFIIITIFLPGISGRSLSTSLARHTLRSYMDSSSASLPISDREYIRANAAYGFLKDNDFGKDRIEKYFTALDPASVEELRERARAASRAVSSDLNERAETAEKDRTEHGSFYMDLVELSKGEPIDISGFNSFGYVTILQPRNRSTENVIDTTALKVFAVDEHYEIYDETSPMETVDLSEYCDKFSSICADADDDLITYDEQQEKISQMSIIDVNENARLYITSADIYRNAEGKTVSVDIRGYMFCK